MHFFHFLDCLWIYNILLTCDTTFAGISCRERLDVVRGIRDLVSPVLNGDGVWACRVRHIGHGVGAIPVILDCGILWLPLWVL